MLLNLAETISQLLTKQFRVMPLWSLNLSFDLPKTSFLSSTYFLQSSENLTKKNQNPWNNFVLREKHFCFKGGFWIMRASQTYSCEKSPPVCHSSCSHLSACVDGAVNLHAYSKVEDMFEEQTAIQMRLAIAELCDRLSRCICLGTSLSLNSCRSRLN